MKVKVCPICKRHNPTTAWDCVSCGADLASVRASEGIQPVTSPLRTAPAIRSGPSVQAALKIPRPADTLMGTTQQPSKGFSLSAEQRACFERLNSCHDHFFVMGKAGTGKSVVLRHFVEHTGKKIAVVAPTGIAAIHVHGQTIHSLFGMKASVQDVRDHDQVKLGIKQKEILRAIEALVIDEISMVRADVMDMIDAKLRVAKSKPGMPFGGCQIIAFGDLYQLPPVMERDECGARFLRDRYSSEFFFAAPGVMQSPFTKIQLQEVHRQSDRAFVDALNRVREGDYSAEVLSVFNTRNTMPPDDQLCITLTPTRAAADAINQEGLSSLRTPERIYHAIVSGKFSKDELPTDEQLHLKPGAHVMMLRNDTNQRWSNGTAGIVEALTADKILVRTNGSIYPVERETWQKYQYAYNEQTEKLEQIEDGSFRQFPVKLAYAITIHKSQGQTYDRVIIDQSHGRAFAPGQMYVALSRCKTLSGLYLDSDLQARDVRVADAILRYMK